MNENKPIIIVGAGIGGLTAGLCLKRAGFEVQIIERFDEVREVGAGILLQPNASGVLYNRLGLGDAIDGVSAQMTRTEFKSWTGRALLAQEEVETDALPGPNRMIHRAALQQVLYDAMGPDKVLLDSPVEGFETGESGTVSAITAGGERISGQALIGADGLHSVIRTQLFGEQATPLRYHGYTCWRGITSAFSHDDFPFGTLMEIQGRGRRAGLGYLDDERIYWWATVDVARDQKDCPNSIHDDLLQIYDEFPEFFRATLKATPTDQILRNDIYDRAPISRWGTGAVTLLGDAAHPTAPNLGQGACSAIEDADMLAICLKGSDDLEQGLRDYERLRQPRTAKLQKLSKRFGDMGQWNNRLMVWLRETSIALLPESLAEKQELWIWDYDAQREYEQAMSPRKAN